MTGTREYGSRREYGGSHGGEFEGRRFGGRSQSYESEYGGRTRSRGYGQNIEEWAERAEEAIHPLEEYAREKPLMSLLIAAGIGALVGILFLRR